MFGWHVQWLLSKASSGEYPYETSVLTVDLSAMQARKRRNERQKKKGSKKEINLDTSNDFGWNNARNNEINLLQTPENEPTSYLSRFSWLWRMCQFLFGVAVACYIGYRYSSFLKLLHENDMWFSEISVSFCPRALNVLSSALCVCLCVLCLCCRSCPVWQLWLWQLGGGSFTYLLLPTMHTYTAWVEFVQYMWTLPIN